MHPEIISVPFGGSDVTNSEVDTVGDLQRGGLVGVPVDSLHVSVAEVARSDVQLELADFVANGGTVGGDIIELRARKTSGSNSAV